MSLFNRRWFLIGFYLFLCGFDPIYGEDKPANQILGKIDVEVLNGRNAFEFAIVLLTVWGSKRTPKYVLKYNLNIESKNLNNIKR